MHFHSFSSEALEACNVYLITPLTMFLCAVLIVSHTRGILIRVQRVSGNFNWSWLNYAWTREKKRTFLPDLITLRSIRFTIVRSPGTRFSIFSGFLSRIKKIETERKRKKDSQIRFVPSSQNYITICYDRSLTREKKGRTIAIDTV